MTRWGHPVAAPIGQQLAAEELLELATHVALVARRLVQGGDVDSQQLEPCLLLARAVHDWTTTSGYAASDRAAMRRAVRGLIESKVPKLEIVRRTEAALTEISEQPDPRD